MTEESAHIDVYIRHHHRDARSDWVRHREARSDVAIKPYLALVSV